MAVSHWLNFFEESKRLATIARQRRTAAARRIASDNDQNADGVDIKLGLLEGKTEEVRASGKRGADQEVSIS